MALKSFDQIVDRAKACIKRRRVVIAGLGGNQAVSLVLQAQPLQHGLDFFSLTHQHRGGKAGILGLKGTQQNVFRVRSGNDHALLAEGLLGTFHDLIKILQFHGDTLSSSLYVIQVLS